MTFTLNVTNTSTGTSFTEDFSSVTERAERIDWLNARGHYAWSMGEPEDYDPDVAYQDAAEYVEATLRCLDAYDDDPCRGPVEYRMALSGTGRSFPRCEKHWKERLREQERINRTYPVMAPADFDPGYAGESWDED